MQEIRLLDILRKHDLGSRVGLREEGQRVKADIEAAIRAMKEKDVLLIDFTGVEVLSHSFADEIIALPLSRLVAREHGEKYLVIRIDKDELCEDLEGALRKRDLALLRLRGSGRRAWTVLGALSDELRETLKVIGDEGPIATGSLAERMGLKLQACSNRVVELGKQHLIRRSRVEGERGVKNENALAIA